MITADVHTHTHFFHGKNTVEEMYAVATEKKLSYYGFSEHSPLPDGFSCLLYREGDMHQAFQDYLNDVQDLKKRVDRTNLIYPELNLPKVLLGVELDFTPSHASWMDHILSMAPYDYIIGTVHFVETDNIGLWDYKSATTDDMYAFFEKYYIFTSDMAKWGKADIVAHPDFVKIHCLPQFTEWLKTDTAKDCIKTAFNEIKKAGMVLEVSTGGLKKKCAQIHPAPPIMEIAADIGLQISFGSDTHNIHTVSHAFEELAQFAKSYGYSKYVIFEQRIPKFLEF